MKTSSFLMFCLFSFLFLHNPLTTNTSQIRKYDSDNIKEYCNNFKFPEIADWIRTDSIEKYGRHNLYDHIDGAADIFLTYDFQELQVAVYQRKDSASVIVEAYIFESPLHAFGIYSQERPAKGSYLKIGIQAYTEDPILNFVCGSCYVRINSHDIRRNADSILANFAKAVAGKIGGTLSFPGIISIFPPENKKQNSEKFFAGDFLGYEFLSSGFTADYLKDDQEYRLFIIEETKPGECMEMLKKYLQLSGCVYNNVREGRYEIKDPNYGDITLSWLGKYIFGVINSASKDERVEHIKLMENLSKKCQSK